MNNLLCKQCTRPGCPKRGVLAIGATCADWMPGEKFRSISEENAAARMEKAEQRTGLGAVRFVVTDLGYEYLESKRRAPAPSNAPVVEHLWCNTCEYGSDRNLCKESEMLGGLPTGEKLHKLFEWQQNNARYGAVGTIPHRSSSDIKSSCPLHELRTPANYPCFQCAK